MRIVLDRFHRKIDYLRVSVTDRCNLRCRYCMPADGVALKDPGEILSLEEIARLVRCASELGVKKVRLTGGEPLVRKGLGSLVAQINAMPGVEEISLTTNGVLLARQAADLKAAGIDRVNISLDTMDKEKFRYVTRGGNVDMVWQGIEAALAAGLEPVKLNVVVIEGFNDDEILDFVRLALDRALHVRFIELMPIGESKGEGHVPVIRVQHEIKRHFVLQAGAGVTGGGPATYYTIPGARGSIGFIGALSKHFCSRCNRLRLTADGKLRLCLQKDLEVDLKKALRQGGDDTKLKQLFLHAVALKPKEHDMEINGWGNQPRNMFQIGG